MSVIYGVGGLALALALQAVLAWVWPGAHGFVDLMLVPVTWYGIEVSQRSAMFTGCAAGLLQDAWFQVATFGVNGFKKTLLGWGMGALAARLDLNHQPGRLLAGMLVSVGDDVLEVVLRRLLDLRSPLPRFHEIVVGAVVTGLLVALTGIVVDRFKDEYRSSQLRRSF